MVMQSEVDDEGRDREAGQLTSRQHPVIAIGLHPPGQGKSEQNQYRGDRASEDAEPRMPLPNVMEKGSQRHIPIVATAGLHQRRGVVAVTLVGNALGEEDAGSLRCQPLHDLVPFGGVQVLGERNVEEAL